MKLLNTIKNRTVRLLKIGLFCSLTLILLMNVSSGQSKKVSTGNLAKIRLEFDNGNFSEVIRVVKRSTGKEKNNSNSLKELELTAYSQVSLKDKAEAEKTIEQALQKIDIDKITIANRINLLFCASWVYRSQRKFDKSFEFAKQALAANPNDQTTQGRYFMNVGRIFFAEGLDISAIIWLEKAAEIFEKAESKEKLSEDHLDTYRFLSLAWVSKGNFSKGLFYAEKFADSASKSEFKYKYRIALYEWANLLNTTSHKRKAFDTFHKGLKLSIQNNHSYQAREFLHTLALINLYDGNLKEAAKYSAQLESLDQDQSFAFEILLMKAVITGFEGKKEISDEIFSQLEKMESTSDFLIPAWRTMVAERTGRWEEVIGFNKQSLELTEKNNFRDDLPSIHLTFAKAYYHLNERDRALDHLQRSFSLIEEFGSNGDVELSLSILETYHNAYRLLTELKSENPVESFESADYLKGQILKDKISNRKSNLESDFPATIRKQLGNLSLQHIDDQSNFDEIEKAENTIFDKIQTINLTRPDLSGLGKDLSLPNSAIISYFFTLDKKLIAFVWEHGKQVRTQTLPVSDDEAENIAVNTQQNIKNRIFFKRDGKTIYDKLIKPLALTSKHLIIVPDKFLWKIPFQALSADGEKYLIEDKLISYAPSVSVLLEQLKAGKPNRQTLQAFANSDFEKKVLQYVNSEATTVAGIYNSKPVINATAGDFMNLSEKTDILHFSMHAEVAPDQPLDSFLGFRKISNDDGHLTVNELLNIKLKKGSLVFLASCDTNNVLSGEGLVSLAWGMLGAGATTVISAQWEANDRSTAIFTKTFYEHYKQGSSSAEAMQKASLELIRDKSKNMHEPYFWADFSLNGDFR